MSNKDRAEGVKSVGIAFYVRRQVIMNETGIDDATKLYAMTNLDELEAIITTDLATPQAPGADTPGGRGPDWKACYSTIIKALGAMVNVSTPDKLFDLDAIPRDPIMEQVTRIKTAIDSFSKSVEAHPAESSGGDAVDAEQMYYLQDTRQYVGNCVTWWGTERRGYVTRLDQAGKYTKDEAFRQAASRSSDVAWPCEVIDKLIRPTIDMQELPTRAAIASGAEHGR